MMPTTMLMIRMKIIENWYGILKGCDFGGAGSIAYSPVLRDCMLSDHIFLPRASSGWEFEVYTCVDSFAPKLTAPRLA